MNKKKQVKPPQLVKFLSYVEIDGKQKAVSVEIDVNKVPLHFLNDGPAFRNIEHDVLKSSFFKLMLNPIKIN